jgi:hypothetical protein
MSFCTLPDELEWSNYTGSRVEANLCRWKFRCGQRMSTRLHNEMDGREDHTHYRCDICNDISHNWKTCHNRQCKYDNTIVCKLCMIYYYILVKHIKLI